MARLPHALRCLAFGAVAAVAGCGGAHRSPLDVAAARRLYVHSGCGACHALADARAHGQIGPDFDASERLNREQIRRGLVEGANGMPSYAHELSRAQRDSLTDYLLRVAWKRSPRRASRG